MPGRGIQHIDLAVSDVERSLAFHMTSSQENHFGDEGLGLRSADGGAHRYYDVGLEHLAFKVERKREVAGDDPSRSPPGRRTR